MLDKKILSLMPENLHGNMLMKLTYWVNFISILRAVFTPTDRKSTKKIDNSVFFALWGSAQVKAACRTLMKLTPYSSSEKIKSFLRRRKNLKIFRGGVLSRTEWHAKEKILATTN